MATTADIKIGMCIEMDGKTFQIVDFQHVKPGKGPAFVRTKLKNLESPMRMIWGRISCTPRLSKRSTSTRT